MYLEYTAARSEYDIFLEDCLCGKKTKPEEHSVDVCQSKPRTLDELEQQFLDACAGGFLIS
jgi:hypothetical protein